MKPAIFLYSFFTAAFFHLIGIYFNQVEIMAISKPLLMPLLGLFAFLTSQNKRSKAIKFILVSLVFSWLGDVFLMFLEKGDLFFMLGLVSFLIAHVLYIVAFISETKDKPGKSALITRPFAAFPFVASYGLLLLILIPNLGDMLIPVIVYATVITFMVLMSLNRYGKVAHNSFVMVLFGAALFMVSDSIIALNKFYKPFDWARLGIMSTYMLGQFLIVKGCLSISDVNKKANKS